MIFNQFALLVCCSPLGADGVDASGSAPAVDIDTPMKVADASIRERHRHVFNLRMFPSLFHDGIMKELKDHPDTSPLSAEMSQREWEETIHIVPLFGPKLLRDATDEQKAFRKKLGAKKSKKWASMVELYEVEEYKLPGSDLPKKRLLRIHTRKGSPEENRLVCVPQLDVFDVISENHGIVSHMKQNQTCVKVHEKYYNVTESQVNAFVDSCETCNQIITVTGRPRTPSDQGSVESMNKLVERIIQDLNGNCRNPPV